MKFDNVGVVRVNLKINNRFRFEFKFNFVSMRTVKICYSYVIKCKNNSKRTILCMFCQLKSIIELIKLLKNNKKFVNFDFI